MKKQKSSIIVLSCSESSGDESEKAKPRIDKEELRKYLQNSDDEDKTIKKTSPKKTKKSSRKEKLLLTIMLIKTNHLKKSKNQRNPLKKTRPKNISSKVMISKDYKKRQRNVAPHLLIIPKEKITNTWLNTTTKRFTSVLPILKISSSTKILIDETSISLKR